MLERTPMILVKCPRCELNYMAPGETLCKVCFREVHHAELREEPELCSECNTERALPGKDLCLFCLQERKNSYGKLKVLGDGLVDLTLGDVSGMEEIIPAIEEDDPDFCVLGDALSLEEMGEQEDRDDEDEDEAMDG